MIYLNEKDLKSIGIPWEETVAVIEKAVLGIDGSDYAQPIKPYLRYGDKKNRIIAMPAFVGSDINIAGIKWIASFPDNIHRGMPRAHSVTVLNEPDTGEPVCIINTALLSIIRTASVSGLVMKCFDSARRLDGFNLGIIGWGPIGRHHLKLCESLFGDRISKVYLYDIRPVIDRDDTGFGDSGKVVVAGSWQEVYLNSDVFFTCTVSKEPYIDLPPVKGSLLMNVSLRDFKSCIFEHVRGRIIVDDWDEVCRENTDIERMHREKGLTAAGTRSIADAAVRGCIKEFREDGAVMFNPMGMAVFDVAMGAYYYRKALEKGIGTVLDEPVHARA